MNISKASTILNPPRRIDEAQAGVQRYAGTRWSGGVSASGKSKQLFWKHCGAAGFTRGTPDNSWTDSSDPWTPPLIPLLVKITLRQSSILVRHEQFTDLDRAQNSLSCHDSANSSRAFNAAPLVCLALVGYDTVPATDFRSKPKSS
jgi:hypothetical protein